MRKVMKPTMSMFFCLALAGGILVSCDKDQDKVTYTGGTPPVLAVSSSSDLVLMKADENLSSLLFLWTNPDYTFSNGVNTQDVYYALQIDTTGANFSTPVELSFTRDVSTTFTVKSLNTALANVGLVDFVPHAFEFRIKSTLANNSVPLYSNVIKINITTYLDVVYPVPANLYITGDATPGGWMAGGDPELLSQKFTKTNAYTFELDNFTFVAGAGFLLVPVYGDWTNKYGFTGTAHANNKTGDSFVPNGNDFGPPNPGTYKVTVNFKTGKYTIQ